MPLVSIKYICVLWARLKHLSIISVSWVLGVPFVSPVSLSTCTVSEAYDVVANHRLLLLFSDAMLLFFMSSSVSAPVATSSAPSADSSCLLLVDRISFKKHLQSCVIIWILLWLLWLITQIKDYDVMSKENVFCTEPAILADFCGDNVPRFPQVLNVPKIIGESFSLLSKHYYNLNEFLSVPLVLLVFQKSISWNIAHFQDPYRKFVSGEIFRRTICYL